MTTTVCNDAALHSRSTLLCHILAVCSCNFASALPGIYLGCPAVLSSLDRDTRTSMTATTAIIFSSRLHSAIREGDTDSREPFRVSALLWCLPVRCLITNSYSTPARRVPTERDDLWVPLFLATKSNFGGPLQYRRLYQLPSKYGHQWLLSIQWLSTPSLSSSFLQPSVSNWHTRSHVHAPLVASSLGQNRAKSRIARVCVNRISSIRDMG